MKQNKNDLKNAKLLAAIINNRFKQKLLEVIGKKQECTVSDLIKATKWPQSVVSAHLAPLRKIGLLETRRNGKFIHYHINSYYERVITEWSLRATVIIAE